MCSDVPLQPSMNWITTAKDIALVILSVTAIIVGFIQSRKNRRAEWVREFRAEMAKLIAISARVDISKEEYTRYTVEHFSLISLYLNYKDERHNQLLKEIELLVTTWKENHEGNRSRTQINTIVGKITKTTKLIIDAEYDKI